MLFYKKLGGDNMESEEKKDMPMDVNQSGEGEVFNNEDDEKPIIDNSEQIQQQMNDLLNEKDLKEYIYSYIKKYDENKRGFTLLKMTQSAYKLLQGFVNNENYKQKYNLLITLSDKNFEKFFRNATISKDLADVILLAWVHCRQSRIPKKESVRGFDKSFGDFKTLYSNNASPRDMVYFLSVFEEKSLSMVDVRNVLLVKTVLVVAVDYDGNPDYWPEYQPTEKTFTIVLKAIESVSYNYKLTKEFMDVICKTLDFKALNDQLKFNDISKIEDEALKEIDCFYAVICNTILHNCLNNKNSEQALEKNDFYRIFNMQETKGTLINFWRNINGASQDPKDNSFYKLLRIDVINKLAENEKNIHAAKLKKFVGDGNILDSLNVKIENKTTEIDKINQFENRTTEINKINRVENKNEDIDKSTQLDLTQTKNENKILIWKNLILILLIALSALAALIFGINIKFLFLAFITNPLSIIITVVAVVLFVGLTIYANKIKAIRLEKLCCGKESDGKPFFNIYQNIDHAAPDQSKNNDLIKK